MRISDWSSDVCSSDLEEKSKAQRELVPASFVEGPGGAQQRLQQRLPERQAAEQHRREDELDDRRLHLDEGVVVQPQGQAAEDADDGRGDQRHGRNAALKDQEIGKASCRERVCQYVSISVVAVSLKKKIKLTRT